jgi:GNAT superfamily N-acetyltransferase
VGKGNSVISYRQDSIVNFKVYAAKLLESHWNEVAMFKDKIPLDPDYGSYMELEDSGALKIFIAEDDGTVIGYFAVICRHNIHYKTTLMAYNDVIYVSPQYRDRGVASGMMDFAEKCLREDGVRVMVVNTKTAHPFDSLLVREGYTHAENIYMKYLE